jgi:hypothetical protein
MKMFGKISNSKIKYNFNQWKYLFLSNMLIKKELGFSELEACIISYSLKNILTIFILINPKIRDE